MARVTTTEYDEETMMKIAESWATQSHYTPFGVKPKYWNTEDQDIGTCSDDMIMPRYSDKQIPFVETPHYETCKLESIEGMIKNWQNMNVRLQSEKLARTPNLKKIKVIEERLDLLTQSLLRDCDFISKNIKQFSLTEMLKTRVR